ncbi:YcjF family protein [Bartonella sp. DGB2]|uniref:YcjF family protein n=1 Tax=Bartonella sp. DGB2 TaxID=3388426 RepID=UPI00398FD839
MTPRKPKALSDFSTIEQEQWDPSPKESSAHIDAPSDKRNFGWGKIALSMLSMLALLALGLWAETIIRRLFSQYTLLGWLALFFASIGLLALVMFLFQEFYALWRLRSVQHIRHKAKHAVKYDDMASARQVVDELVHHTRKLFLAQKGRQVIKNYRHDIIDGRQHIYLAEAEILRPLDEEARRLVINTAKRVSIVTAVSPRALIDLAYVFYELIRLIRTIASLYGCRPGKLGFISLVKRVLSHLAVTGAMAMGDGLLQQIVGHSLASRLSARLGEGFVNGLMTARIGIAAIDALRPFPFQGEKRPTLSDFSNALMTVDNSNKQTESAPIPKEV